MIINAKTALMKARENANNILNARLEEELGKVETAIEKAVQAGREMCSVFFHISREANAFLREKGYDTIFSGRETRIYFEGPLHREFPL